MPYACTSNSSNWNRLSMNKTSKWLEVNGTFVELKPRMLDDTYDLNNSQTLDHIMIIPMANSYLEEAPHCYEIGSSAMITWSFCHSFCVINILVWKHLFTTSHRKLATHVWKFYYIFPNTYLVSAAALVLNGDDSMMSWWRVNDTHNYNFVIQKTVGNYLSILQDSIFVSE